MKTRIHFSEPSSHCCKARRSNPVKRSFLKRFTGGRLRPLTAAVSIGLLIWGQAPPVSAQSFDLASEDPARVIQPPYMYYGDVAAPNYIPTFENNVLAAFMAAHGMSDADRKRLVYNRRDVARAAVF